MIELLHTKHKWRGFNFNSLFPEGHASGKSYFKTMGPKITIQKSWDQNSTYIMSTRCYHLTLGNAPAAFQRLIKQLIAKLNNIFTRVPHFLLFYCQSFECFSNISTKLPWSDSNQRDCN